MGIALGFLNMPLKEFWDITPRQLQLKIDSKKEYEEMLQRGEWERMRFQTTALINKDRKRSEQIKMQDLITFEWEKNKRKKHEKSDRDKAMYLIHKEKLKQKELEKNKDK
tara:strand:+ start:13073 stop:13402 length:330 start_codon:yes stop_codon:yes gene_type:complete